MTGDILAQKGFEERELHSLDLLRTARLGLYGGCMFIQLTQVESLISDNGCQIKSYSRRWLRRGSNFCREMLSHQNQVQPLWQE